MSERNISQSFYQTTFGEMAWVKSVKRRLKNGVSKSIKRGKSTSNILPHSIKISEAVPRIKKKISFSEAVAPEISRKSEN